MCDTPDRPHYAADPDALRLIGVLRDLVSAIAAHNAQLDRLYEQRHFELQSKYGQQSFLDFQERLLRTKSPIPPCTREAPATRDPSEPQSDRQ